MDEQNNESLESEYEQLTIPEFTRAAILLCVDWLYFKLKGVFEALKKVNK